MKLQEFSQDIKALKAQLVRASSSYVMYLFILSLKERHVFLFNKKHKICLSWAWLFFSIFIFSAMLHKCFYKQKHLPQFEFPKEMLFFFFFLPLLCWRYSNPIFYFQNKKKCKWRQCSVHCQLPLTLATFPLYQICCSLRKRDSCSFFAWLGIPMFLKILSNLSLMFLKSNFSCKKL